ncbi:hypothetical protein [Spirabiliibacterium falconis]|uniref:hypothetical protein n=1 Tax=Spirabiliibacterium falconis TaxID=572023 RepID=UPI001AADC7F0|nr:hypothetical protein [Spirabiliibacterium falconis]MBE2894176.1 hypothetical protein [Spirabiliibacterium falconis]
MMKHSIIIALSVVLIACTNTPQAIDSALPSYQAQHQKTRENVAPKTQDTKDTTVLNASDYVPKTSPQPVRITPMIGIGYGFGEYNHSYMGTTFYPWWW